MRFLTFLLLMTRRHTYIWTPQPPAYIVGDKTVKVRDENQTTRLLWSATPRPSGRDDGLVAPPSGPPLPSVNDNGLVATASVLASDMGAVDAACSWHCFGDMTRHNLTHLRPPPSSRNTGRSRHSWTSQDETFLDFK